jgi:hypothetical protein
MGQTPLVKRTSVRTGVIGGVEGVSLPKLKREQAGEENRKPNVCVGQANRCVGLSGGSEVSRFSLNGVVEPVNYRIRQDVLEVTKLSLSDSESGYVSVEDKSVLF